MAPDQNQKRQTTPSEGTSGSQRASRAINSGPSASSRNGVFRTTGVESVIQIGNLEEGGQFAVSHGEVSTYSYVQGVKNGVAL